jgi:nucleoside-diphosphate-sugar epimerase
MGIWILKTLLDQGFSVKAVVRNESKITYLRDKFIEQASQLEFVIIEDFSAPNAFDEVVKGVTGIIHNASPVVLSHDPNLDANDLIRPAVGGTLSLLNSALKSPTIQRVVVTSSTGAVLEPKPFPAVYTEVSMSN